MHDKRGLGPSVLGLHRVNFSSPYRAAREVVLNEKHSVTRVVVPQARRFFHLITWGGMRKAQVFNCKARAPIHAGSVANGACKGGFGPRKTFPVWAACCPLPCCTRQVEGSRVEVCPLASSEGDSVTRLDALLPTTTTFHAATHHDSTTTAPRQAREGKGQKSDSEDAAATQEQEASQASSPSFCFFLHSTCTQAT